MPFSSGATEKAVEAVLDGLSHSPLSEHLIVRGSCATQQWMGPFRRPIKDLDLLYVRSEPLASIFAAFKAFLGTCSRAHLWFDTPAMEESVIWGESLTPGYRLVCPYRGEDDEDKLQIDMSMGDPLIVPPLSIVLPFGSQPITVKTVALEIAAAWKLHGLFENINGPWQSKTLWDLYLFCRFNTLDIALFRQAVALAFSSRLDPVCILKRLLYGDFGQSKTSARSWEQDFSSFGGTAFVPLNEVLIWLSNFLTPIFEYANDGTLLTHADVVSHRVNLLRGNTSPEARQKRKALNKKVKVLTHKAYPSIPHLPESRLGVSDKHIDAPRALMLTQQSRHDTDRVVVQEKLDGSCVCVYRFNDKIFALGKDGDLAECSPNASRQLWANWVLEHKERFLRLLDNGERVCGEWLAMVHGTRYHNIREPFVVFDLFDTENRALSYEMLHARVTQHHFETPTLLHNGDVCSVEQALANLDKKHYPSLDMPEGAIWRLERNNRVLFRAKYVRPDKIDGCYLSEKTGQPSLWHWQPSPDPT
jgi:hypothetical protein